MLIIIQSIKNAKCFKNSNFDFIFQYSFYVDVIYVLNHKTITGNNVVFLIHSNIH